MLSPGQVSAPRVGLARYASGGVYPVFGVQANYVLGNRLFDGVDALSFSEAGGLLSQRGSLLLLDANLATIGSFSLGSRNQGDVPIVGIDRSLTSAIAWLPAHHTLVHWNGSDLVSIVIPEGTVNGEVLTVSKVGTDLGIVATKSLTGVVEETTVSLRSGTSIAHTLVPGVNGNVYRQGKLVVSVQNGQLVTTAAANGTRKAVPIPADDVSFERISATCVHLHAAKSDRDWLLHFAGDQSLLFELPKPAAESAAPMVAQ